MAPYASSTTPGDPAARFVLLLACDDRPGLVAEVANFVGSASGNIVAADQHIDTESGSFFQRVEFDAPAGHGELADGFTQVAERNGMRWQLRKRGHRPRVAVLASSAQHCVADLLAREHYGDLGIDIVAVVSNHTAAADLAASFNKNFHHVAVSGDSGDLAVRTEHENRISEVLDEANVELVVLARYMRVLSDRFVAGWDQAMINIHHSFLPAFIGANPYRQAHRRGVKLIGATAHYVTAELDDGPIISQDVTAVSHRDSVADLTRKGRDVEVRVLADAVRAHVEHRVLVDGNRTIVFA